MFVIQSPYLFTVLTTPSVQFIDWWLRISSRGVYVCRTHCSLAPIFQLFFTLVEFFTNTSEFSSASIASWRNFCVNRELNQYAPHVLPIDLRSPCHSKQGGGTITQFLIRTREELPVRSEYVCLGRDKLLLICRIVWTAELVTPTMNYASSRATVSRQKMPQPIPT